MSGFDRGRLQRLGKVLAGHIERDGTGGLGSSWGNDPGERLIGVVLTTDMFTGAFPPPAVIRDFWTSLYAALGD